jgi:uncharacterized protein
MGRPVPTPTWLTAPFWEAARNGELTVQQCLDCAAYIFRPEAACTACLGPNLQWRVSSGRGTVHSFTICEVGGVTTTMHPDAEIPYVVSVVEMAEGWHMMSNIIGCDVHDVVTGLAVRVAFVDYGDMRIPFFRSLLEDA